MSDFQKINDVRPQWILLILLWPEPNSFKLHSTSVLELIKWLNELVNVLLSQVHLAMCFGTLFTVCWHQLKGTVHPNKKKIGHHLLIVISNLWYSFFCEIQKYNCIIIIFALILLMKMNSHLIKSSEAKKITQFRCKWFFTYNRLIRYRSEFDIYLFKYDTSRCFTPCLMSVI